LVAGKRRNSFTGEEVRMHDELEVEKLFQQGLFCCGGGKRGCVMGVKDKNYETGGLTLFPPGGWK